MALNKILEVLENLKYFGSFLEEVDPCKFAIAVNETNIIGVSTNRSRSTAPNIRKNQL